MDEGIAGLSLPVLPSKTPVSRQSIPELEEHALGIFSGIRSLNAVVEMDLDLAPPSLAMLGQTLNQALVVVLGRVKISVAEWPTVGITPRVCHLWVLPAPFLNPALSLVEPSILSRCFRFDFRLEVVSQANNQMRWELSL
jgi:hypothetical protein